MRRRWRSILDRCDLETAVQQHYDRYCMHRRDRYLVDRAGAVLAVFSMDLKRTLACSSVSQIGFILVGIGVSTLLRAENALAARGALLHMVNHSLIKLVLFLCAGAVFMNLHQLNLNDIRGFGRRKQNLSAGFLRPNPRIQLRYN